MNDGEGALSVSVRKLRISGLSVGGEVHLGLVSEGSVIVGE